MSAIDQRKALDRLSLAYRRLLTGGRPPPAEPGAETPPEGGQAQLPPPLPPAQPAPEAP